MAMKILGCDYDGTLNYGGIDEAKRAAIKKWQAQGNKLGATNRSVVEESMDEA